MQWQRSLVALSCLFEQVIIIQILIKLGLRKDTEIEVCGIFVLNFFQVRLHHLFLVERDLARILRHLVLLLLHELLLISGSVRRLLGSFLVATSASLPIKSFLLL